MKRTLISSLPTEVPSVFLRFLSDARIYDSSCSPEARVYFIEKDGGYYLKTAAKGSLAREAEMTAYFHKKRLGAEVLSYTSEAKDWLLTARVAGEDATHAEFLSHPERLCDVMAEALRALHETDARDCPIQNRMEEYLALADRNFETGNYDKTHFPDSFGYASAEEARAVLNAGRGLLKNEVLLHGDYCLPNIMLKDFKISGFIDVGNGGVGDRHVDLFWGAWTLWFNLGTDRYRDRFLDAYGRDLVDKDKLCVIAAAEVFG